MFNRMSEPTVLELEIDRMLLELKDHPVTAKEHTLLVDAVKKLHEMKTSETSSPVSKDTLAIIGANLLGILLIIKHENVNVITTKALSLLIRTRV